MANDQAQLFKAGGGTFDVYFDGSDISWSLSSVENLVISAHNASANIDSPRCDDGFITKKSYSSKDAADHLNLSNSESSVYPNPVTDIVKVRMNAELANDDVTLVDMHGRILSVAASRIDKNALELNLSGVKPGLYILRVNTVDSIRNVQLMKQ